MEMNLPSTQFEKTTQKYQIHPRNLPLPFLKSHFLILTAQLHRTPCPNSPSLQRKIRDIPNLKVLRNFQVKESLIDSRISEKRLIEEMA